MSSAMETSRTLLLTGGTRSGKSALALRWAEAQSPRRIFVATARPLDAETALRVARHQDERGTGWTTREEPFDVLATLCEVSRPNIVVVVDCITMWLANVWGADFADPVAAPVTAPVIDAVTEEGAERPPEQATAASLGTALGHVQALAEWLPKAPGPVVLVTAEVGMGIVPVSSAGRAFRDMQGEANQMLARACSTVLLASCGLPLALKNSIPKELL